MTTPNNAAALERLEQKWREESAAELTHCKNKELSEWIRARCYGQYCRLLLCAAELAKIRAITSQTSGEVVSIPVVQQTAPERIWLAVADDAYYADEPFPDGEEVCWSSDAPLEVCVPYVRADLATHPSADALRVAVDEWRPIESAPKEAPYWVVWSAYYQRPVVVTQRSNDNTYWEGDWGFDVQATHWTAALAPKPEGGQ